MLLVGHSTPLCSKKHLCELFHLLVQGALQQALPIFLHQAAVQASPVSILLLPKGVVDALVLGPSECNPGEDGLMVAAAYWT